MTPEFRVFAEAADRCPDDPGLVALLRGLAGQQCTEEQMRARYPGYDTMAALAATLVAEY